MNRQLIIGTTALGLLFAAACNQSPAKQEEQARAAQQKADEKSAEYRNEAEQKSAEQQAKANDEAREANRALDKTRNDYRQKAQSDLDSLTKQIDELRAKSAKTQGQARVDIDRSLADVTAKRNAVEAQIRSLDAASAEQIDGVKSRLDDQMAALRQSVKDVDKQI